MGLKVEKRPQWPPDDDCEWASETTQDPEVAGRGHQAVFRSGCVCVCVCFGSGAHPGMHWKGGRPSPLQGAQPMPSHCFPDGRHFMPFSIKVKPSDLPP